MILFFDRYYAHTLSKFVQSHSNVHTDENNSVVLVLVQPLSQLHLQLVFERMHFGMYQSLWTTYTTTREREIKTIT
jgi:hypothetical protein